MPRRPAINAPGIVIAIVLALIIVHGVRISLPLQLERQFLLNFAFIPSRLGILAGGWPAGDLWAAKTLVTHAFLHGDWLHLLINSAWLLAFGSLVARRTNVLRFLGLFVLSAICGALLFLAVNGPIDVIVIGASGAVSGLMGGGFRLIFSVSDRVGWMALRSSPDLVPRMPLQRVIWHRPALVATGLWVCVNLLFGLLYPSFLSAGGIAWEAHLGGFFTGFLLFGCFDQGAAWTVRSRPGV